MFKIDNCCYPYHICNKASWFQTLDKDRTDTIDAVAGTPGYIRGIGTVQFNVLNSATNKVDSIMLTDVAYMPDQQHNLISHSRLVESGLQPDYTTNSVTAPGCNYRFDLQNGVFPWTESDAEHEIHKIHAAASLLSDRSDWMWSPAEFATYHSRYSFDYELFRQPGNEHPIPGSSGDAFADPWIHRSYYGNPVYDNNFIHRTLLHALDGYNKAPDDTSFFFVLPYWPESPWWHLTTHFEEVHRYPKGTKLFTSPGLSLRDPSEFTPDHMGRYYIKGSPWPVCLFYKNRYTSVTVDNDWLLHLRLGHPESRVIKEVHTRGQKTGLKPPRLDSSGLCKCSICLRANMLKPHAPATGTMDADHPFQLVFADTHGPVNPTSMEGYRHSVCFIDACSRYPKTYYLRSYSDVTDALIQYLAWIKSLGYSVQSMVLRTDNFSSFVGGQFRDVLIAEGVEPQTTAPYVHTNNAVVERFWRTILAITRTLLMTAKLDHRYWPLAWDHAIYLYTLRPHRFLSMDSPHERLFKEQPDFSPLRVFGCQAYAHVDESQRTKLADRSVSGLYVGHDKHSHCYLILQPDTGKIIRSGRVHFNEDFASLGEVVSQRVDAIPPVLETPDPHQPPPADLRLDASNLLLQATRVTAHSVYFNAEDAETHAVLYVHTVTDVGGFWVHAKDFLSPPCPPRNSALLVRYLASYHSQHQANPFYPIFTRVDVTRSNQKNAPTDPAFIISTDDTPRAREPFGVCYDNSNSPLDDMLYPQDVSRVRVLFPAVASAASTPSSSEYVEPTTFIQSQTYPDAPMWLEATNDEVQNFIDKRVLLPLDATEIPDGANIVGSRFVYKLKREADGTIERYKARLVAQGFTQEYGVDYTETFAPVSQVLSVRLCLILTVQLGLRAHHVDVKCAFLNATLREEVYIRLPKGFNIGGKTYGRALKSIYGLKQAAHDWHQLQHNFIMGYDSRIRQSASEPCLYYIMTEDLQILINTHVDDYTICVNDDQWYQTFILAFSKQFECEEKGQVTHLLQTKVVWSDDGTEVSLLQSRHIDDLSQQYNVNNCKPMNTPMEHGLQLSPADELVSEGSSRLPYRQLLGSLWWIARVTRPDIMFAVAYLSRFANCHSDIHYSHLLRVLKYLKTTSTQALRFRKHAPETAPLEVSSYSDADRFPDEPMLTGDSVQTHSDSDWAGDKFDRRSVSGNITFLYGNPVNWNSHRQTTVALSSAEAEYYAMTDATKEALLVRQLLRELSYDHYSAPVPIHVDNMGAKYIAENMINNKRTKHIDIRYHFIRHYIQDKAIRLDYVPTKLNIADLMTKALPIQDFRRLSRMLLEN